MGFPASLSLCVLSFPSLTLSLVAFHPFLGFGIEAFGVLVVALFVVLSGHAVERRIELFRVGINALVGLLQRQGDTTTLEVDVDDLDEDLVANLDDLLGQLDVTLSKFGDVNQTFNSIFNTHECAEGNELGDLAGHDLANSVGTCEGLPRIFLGSLQRQRHALAVHVDIQHLDGDFLANLDDL